MIVKIDKSLQKDVRKIRVKTITSQLAKVIIEIQSAPKLSSVKNLKKIKGAGNFYRIRIGDYRLGIAVNGEEIELIQLLHRKEIYRFFPQR